MNSSQIILFVGEHLNFPTAEIPHVLSPDCMEQLGLVPAPEALSIMEKCAHGLNNAVVFPIKAHLVQKGRNHEQFSLDCLRNLLSVKGISDAIEYWRWLSAEYELNGDPRPDNLNLVKRDGGSALGWRTPSGADGDPAGEAAASVAFTNVDGLPDTIRALDPSCPYGIACIQTKGKTRSMALIVNDRSMIDQIKKEMNEVPSSFEYSLPGAKRVRHE